ncbi:MAG: LicD family protein [Lachnospiraceae bacterium]|nr:LicD family protein [Lachnospiraceae bacterium]
MDFADSFMEDEVIEGFYVPSIMKRSWAASLELLSIFDGFCEAHDLPYCIYAGTLLGAIRHGGFIPWDDDIDVLMFREDYNRFLKHVNTFHPEHMYLLRPEKTSNLCLTMKLTNQEDFEQFDRDPVRLKKFHGFPFPILMDVFAFDLFLHDKEKQSAREEMASAAVSCLKTLIDEDPDDTEKEAIEGILRISEKHLHIQADPADTQIDRLFHILHKLCDYPYTDSSELSDTGSVLLHYLRGTERELHAVYWGKRAPIPFETESFYGPADYDAVLRECFGDYMIPVKNYDIHGYPFFGYYEEVVHQTFGKKWIYRYTYSEEDLIHSKSMASDVQSTVSESLHLLERLHTLCKSALVAGRREEALQLLAQCRQIAVSAGNLLERSRENRETVHLLESYCEEIYDLHRRILEYAANP